LDITQQNNVYACTDRKYIRNNIFKRTKQSLVLVTSIIGTLALFDDAVHMHAHLSIKLY